MILGAWLQDRPWCKRANTRGAPALDKLCFVGQTLSSPFSPTKFKFGRKENMASEEKKNNEKGVAVRSPMRLIFCILILFLLIACAKPQYRPDSIIASPSFKMLIASNGTDFKNVIFDRLVDRYKDSGNIYLTSINKLNRLNPKIYDVIVIMDSCIAGSRFNRSIKRFLNGIVTKDKVVLVLTAADPEWQFSYKGIDAITSASAVENEDKIFTLATLQIDQILRQAN